MKKLIQLLSVLSLAFAFSIVSAQAQSVKKYNAEIPFDFNIGQNSYQAGSYVIKIINIGSNGAILMLEDDKRHQLETSVVFQISSVSKTEPRLLFNRYDNQRFLAKIVTPESAIKLQKSKTEKLLTAQNHRSNSYPQITLATAHAR